MDAAIMQHTSGRDSEYRIMPPSHLALRVLTLRTESPLPSASVFSRQKGANRVEARIEEGEAEGEGEGEGVGGGEGQGAGGELEEALLRCRNPVH